VSDNTRIFPSHGPLGSRADLVAYRDMLQTAHATVASLVRQGKSLEEIQAVEPLAQQAEKWAKGFIKADVFVELVYEGMVQ
jgi:hypothetical protein